jgi:hypothetical protein
MSGRNVSKVHDRVQPLQVVTLCREFPQTLIDIKNPLAPASAALIAHRPTVLPFQPICSMISALFAALTK